MRLAIFLQAVFLQPLLLRAGGRIPVTFWTDGSQGCFAADRSSIWYVKLDKFVEEINYDDGG